MQRGALGTHSGRGFAIAAQKNLPILGIVPVTILRKAIQSALVALHVDFSAQATALLKLHNSLESKVRKVGIGAGI